MAEIQRLAASSADMQAELAFRPTRGDIDDLNEVIRQLRDDLLAQTTPRHTLDKCVETSHSQIPETALDMARREFTESETIETGKISAEIDEMFRLDYEEDDDDTDSATSEINKDGSVTIIEESIADTSAAGEFVRLGDEARLQVTLANGSLHALEEELVRAKESWAEVSAERARLAAQLTRLQKKPGLRVSTSQAIALAVLILAVMMYYLLPYVS